MAPIPQSASFEYLIPSLNYDVDCSDGVFDFYLYQSTAMGNFGSPNPAPQQGDPRKVEIRPIGVSGLPGLIYERVKAETFRFESHDIKNLGHLEENDPAFRIELKPTTLDGKRAEVAPGEVFLVDLLVDKLSGAGGAGSLKEYIGSNCTSTPLSSPITVAPGKDHFEFCYDPTGVASNSEIRILARKTGLTDGQVLMKVHPQYSALAKLVVPNGTSFLPKNLIRNAPYEFKVYPEAYRGQFVSNFTGGQIRVIASHPSIILQGLGASGCPTTEQVGSITCDVLSPTNYPRFSAKVPSQHTSQSVSLKVELIKPTPCDTTNCTIFSGSANHTITDVIDSEFFFSVVNGTMTYDRPLIILRERPVIELNRCLEAYIVPGNSDGTPFPVTSALGSLSFQIVSESGGATFYGDNFCTVPNTLNLPTPFTLSSSSDASISVWIKVNSLPANGVIQVNMSDGVKSLTHEFYVEGNGP